MISPTAKNGRVLIIDDELGPRESLRILLKKEYEVFCADSVQKGLDVLQNMGPNVIVSDIRMPGVNGIEGLKMIRSIDRDVPVIMLTGYGALETAQEAIRHGASDYMKKPFDAQEMLSVIRRNVERSEFVRRREESLQELEELNKRLVEEMSDKTRLASMGQASAELVHDLRNPMGIVLGYIQMLSQDLLDQEEAKASDTAGGDEKRAYMDAIEKNVRRCKDIIDSWLDLSRNSQITLKPINLVDVVKDVVDTAENLAADRKASLDFTVASDTIPVMGHEVQLRRALHNLVSNAIDALPRQGGRVIVGCRVCAGSVELSVTDNGRGIGDEDLSDIFKPYVTHKHNGHGTGLGLFITQNIVEDHHGSISIDSKEGKGTIATIRLPALEKAEQPA